MQARIGILTSKLKLLDKGLPLSSSCIIVLKLSGIAAYPFSREKLGAVQDKYDRNYAGLLYKRNVVKSQKYKFRQKLDQTKYTSKCHTHI